jgi:RimJ/RimL family protein N-acetyltransferase
MNKCVEFLAFQDEHPVEPNSAETLFNDHPEGYDISSKRVYGIYLADDRQLIGVVDLLFYYPDSNSACIGLFMLDPDYRNCGLGKEAYFMVEKEILKNSMMKIRLGVLEGNMQGFYFWKKMGFSLTGERKPYLSKYFRVMEKKLS